MRQKMSNETAEQTKPEAQSELTIKEITGKESPTQAAPLTAQGGTKNTRRHQRSGRAWWSRVEDGPPPSSSAADISRYNLPECGFSAAEHVHHIRTKTKPAFKCAHKDGINLHTPTLKLLFFFFFSYAVNLKPGGICQSESTQFLLWFYSNMCVCVCVTMVQLIPHSAFFIFTHVWCSYGEHTKRFHSVWDPLT